MSVLAVYAGTSMMQSHTVANGISFSLTQRNCNGSNNMNASVRSTFVDMCYVTGMLGYNTGVGNAKMCSNGGTSQGRWKAAKQKQKETTKVKFTQVSEVYVEVRT